MRYALENVSDYLFVDELQDAVYESGVQISAIAEKFKVSEARVADWLLGTDFPPPTVEHAILNWLMEILDY